MKILSLAFSALAVLVLPKAEATDKPNIIFIFTDDQDYQLNSLDFMPNVQKHLVEKGTLFKNHYATISVCCPSRVSLLRGQYSHNTNITDVSPPYGGYNRFNGLKLGEDYLPLWLQNAGYNTNYIGKLMNQYSVNNYNNPTPKGFNYQDQLVDPYTYVYNTAVFSKNGEAPVYYKDAYQTDIIHAKAKAALKRLGKQKDPFFLWVSPMAPHAQFVIHENGTMDTTFAVPAARHSHLFKDVKIVPRNANFNPLKQTKTASYWKYLKKLNETTVENFDEAYRNRLRALQAVDEIVGSIFDELEKQNNLDNTYIFYSSDNGYHLGQHRSYPGKTSNIEEDINVPFIVRGPGVPQGKVSDTVSTHHDLPSTFLALANAEVPAWVDGGVIPINKKLKHHHRPASKESFAVEFWSDTNLEEIYNSNNGHIQGPNIYKTVRVIAPKYNYMYSVWCTGEHELYDLKNDPYETHNIHSFAHTSLVTRLDALLIVLKSCRAESCRNPWKVLHPDGTVATLEDALDSKYDEHYTQFKPVTFKECLPYYNVANEIPQLVPASPDAGQVLPEDDFEKNAIPVSEKLLNTPVNWSKYNFYSFGN
ncbi:arylsulfatase [Sporodiniella umbellata]|nr:arylsulfatase [Sporodiniella umbellata]